VQVQKSGQTLLGLHWVYSGAYDATYQETGADNNGTLRTEVLKYPNGGTPQTILRSYTYDGANRISSYSEPGKSQAFDYDAFGNVWQTGTESGVPALRQNGPSWYLASDQTVKNRLASTDYDAAGYQRQLSLTYGGPNATYDAEGRLVEVAFGGVVATYEYDAEGRRVKRTNASGVATYYIYDADGQLMAEYGGASTGSGTQYVVTDHLGSTRMLQDAQGNCLARADYAPYGAVVPRPGQDCYATPSDGRLFTGALRDGATGLDHMGAREYYSTLARFTSPDPENAGADPASPGSWNMYSYAYNNPLMYTDPTGLAGICGTDPKSETGADKPYCSAMLALEFLLRNLEAKFNAAEKVFDWASKPRDPTCLASSTAAGSAAGTGVGVFAGGPGGQLVTVPTSFAIGGGLGWVAGMTACADNKGPTDGGGGGKQAAGGSESNPRKTNPTKAESPVWKNLGGGGGNTKTSGSGSSKRYYRWDHTHNDIEVFDKRGRHLGSMDPTTGEMYKPPVAGRKM
jgi:RHS repeat-associated protein